MCANDRAADRDPNVLPDFIESRNGDYSIRFERELAWDGEGQSIAVIVGDDAGKSEASFTTTQDVRTFAYHLLRMADLVDEVNDGR